MLVFWGAELWYYLLSFLSESCLTFENNLASIYNMYRHKKIDSTLLEFNYCKMFSACFYISLDFIRWTALNFMDWSFSIGTGKNCTDWWLTLFPRNKVSGLGSSCQVSLQKYYGLCRIFSYLQPAGSKYRDTP